MPLAVVTVACRTGGLAPFAPDCVCETVVSDREHGRHDGDGPGVPVSVAHMGSHPRDDTHTVDYAYLLRDRDRSTRVLHDRHVEGLFSRER